MAIIKTSQLTKKWNWLPLRTGVYLFLNHQKKPIYIGKAANLRNRIKHYFQGTALKKEKLIGQKAIYLEYREANSEFEALILEANLIRQHQPIYNVVLKDDKSSLYLTITKANYPKVRLLRKTELDHHKYVFGPLPSVRFGRLIVRKLRRIVPFCTEKQLGIRPCFYTSLGLCHPCPNEIEATSDKLKKQGLNKQYQGNIKRLTQILKGQGTKVIKQLKETMREYSKDEQYEEAADLRDRIFYLERLFQGRLILDDRMLEADYLQSLRLEEHQALQKVLKLPKLDRIECYDVSNYAFKEATASMVVFQKGIPDTDQYRRFGIKTRERFDPTMLTEVILRRLRHLDWQKPELMVIDGGTPQLFSVYPALLKKYQALPKIIGLVKNPDRVVLAESMSILPLPTDSLALHYLQRIRDEAHRFAKKYHLLLRKKTLLRMMKN